MSDEKYLREAFEAFDADHNGTIDIKEMKAVLKEYYELTKEPADDAKITTQAQRIIKAVDKGGDGKISLEEFIAAFK